jgi:hypothetical protein
MPCGQAELYRLITWQSDLRADRNFIIVSQSQVAASWPVAGERALPLSPGGERDHSGVPRHTLPPPSIITRQATYRDSFRSVRELTNVIDTFVEAFNDHCQPFTWTKTATNY